MVLSPGTNVPQLIEFRGIVHVLSVYTPRFAETVTVPVVERFLLVLSAAYVVVVRTVAIITNVVIAKTIFLFVTPIYITCRKC